jgi:hypothetical protein
MPSVPEQPDEVRHAALSKVYGMIWSRVLGPNYGLIVSHMTIEEAQALTHVGLNGNKDVEGRSAFEIVEGAIARIAGSSLKDDEPTIPLTSHPLEAVAPSFAHAVRRKDSFGLAPCLLRLEASERAALMRELIEHETLRHRAFYTSSLADEILTMVWMPDENFPHFGVSFEIGSQDRSIVGLNEPLPEEVKEENRRAIREAQQEGKRRRASGEVDPREQREAALIAQLQACVRRLDVRTATRVLRGIRAEVDRHFLLLRIRLDLDDESAVRFDAAVCEAAAWVFESEKPAPGIADLLVTELLIALRESRLGEGEPVSTSKPDTRSAVKPGRE